MPAFARILAATDLSAPARHAVDRGFRIAAECGARYSVMHALQLDALDSLIAQFREGTAQLKQQLEDEARLQLLQTLADPARNRGVNADALIVHGNPLEAIIRHADACAPDLLILGARGESFLQHTLFGSTASRLLRKTQGCPVLVVKQPPHEPYRKLLITVDFSPASLNAIHLARTLAPEAMVVLLHAFELPFEGKLVYAGVAENIIQHYLKAARDDAYRRLGALAASAGLPPEQYTLLVKHGDAAQQILAQEQELDADLIIMGKHGTHLSEELLLGSVTKHLLDESQSDVLIITDGREAAPGPIHA